MIIKNNGRNAPLITASVYEGNVIITVQGSGQALGTSQSDAFYILTDYSGNKVTPIKANEFSLYINGRRLQDFYPQGYVKGSKYYFKLVLGDTPKTIAFAIGDLYTSDNAGAFRIAVKGSTVNQLIIKLERRISELETKLIETEKRLMAQVDKALIQRVKGRILCKLKKTARPGTSIRLMASATTLGMATRPIILCAF